MLSGCLSPGSNRNLHLGSRAPVQGPLSSGFLMFLPLFSPQYTASIRVKFQVQYESLLSSVRDATLPQKPLDIQEGMWRILFLCRWEEVIAEQEVIYLKNSLARMTKLSLNIVNLRLYLFVYYFPRETLWFLGSFCLLLKAETQLSLNPRI